MRNFSASLSPSTSLPGLHGAGTRRGIALQPTRCQAGDEHELKSLRPVTLALSVLGFGREQAFFPTYQSSSSSWACARPSPNPVPFLELLGFLTHPIQSFPQLDSSPLWRHLLRMPQQRTLPFSGLPPPGNLGEHRLAPC